VHSHLFVACLKVFFLALSSLCHRFEKLSVFTASLPLRSKRKCPYQPLWKNKKSGTFSRFTAALSSKKLPFFACLLPV